MIQLRYPVNALVSYHYFAKQDISRLHAGGLRIVGDSGAFSAANLGTPVDIDAFADWAKRWRTSLCWVASLDVIGDPKGSWKNYRRLRDRHELDVIPTIHYGSAPSLLDQYAADGVDMVGLGGMVGRKGQPKHLLRWCLSVFRYAKANHPSMRFHGWGVTHPLLVESLPWFSVDSSGFSAAYRYGRATIYDPDTRSKVSFQTDGRDAYQHATLLRKHYGVSAQRVAVSTRETRHDLIRLSAKSYQLLEDRLRRKHQVTAPTYGQNDRMDGPSVHAAASAEDKTIIESLTGPRVHQAMGTDKATPNALSGGPNIHAVDAAPGHLAALAKETA